MTMKAFNLAIIYVFIKKNINARGYNEENI